MGQFAPVDVTSRCRRWMTLHIGPCRVAAPLPNATTATVVPVTAEDRHYILKWFTWEPFIAESRSRVEHEAQGLDAAHRAGVPAPSLVAIDPTGTATGHPAILMSSIRGASFPRPRTWPDLAAAAAVQLHESGVAVHRDHVLYNPDPFAPDWAEDGSVWEAAIAAAADATPERHAVIHRDLHRWNMLWSEGRLSGIVDWLSVSNGPVGEDIGRVWVNEVLEGDPDEGSAFRAAYRRRAAREWDARWELQAVLDMLPAFDGEAAVHEWGTPLQRRRLEACLRNAVDRL